MLQLVIILPGESIPVQKWISPQGVHTYAAAGALRNRDGWSLAL